MKFWMLAAGALLLGLSVHGQEKPKAFYTPEDVRIFEDYCEKFRDRRDLPMNELVAETGKYFLGRPYVNYTLEAKDPEELIVNLRELDCVTFVETAVALARTLKADSATFDLYCDNLRLLRYRDGELKNFTSRLHYFSDWIADNEALGLVEDRTKELGGSPYPIRACLMSKYPKNYPQLVKYPQYIPVMAAIEDSMSRRRMYSVSRDSMARLDEPLRDGYIIGTTTPGQMDVTHVGFVYHVDGKPHFMHASSKQKEVVITEGTLEDYLKSIRSMTGFMAVRVLDPTESDRAGDAVADAGADRKPAAGAGSESIAGTGSVSNRDSDSDREEDSSAEAGSDSGRSLAGK